MARLPRPGQDSGQWGDILNDYLSQAHDSSGKLKADAVGPDALKAGSVQTSSLASEAVTTGALADSSVTGAKLADGSVTSSKLATATAASLAKADSSVQLVNAIAPVNGNVTLTASDIGAIPASQKGTSNGIAELDSSGKIPEARIPDSVTSKAGLAWPTLRNPLGIVSLRGTIPQARIVEQKAIIFRTDSIGAGVGAGGILPTTDDDRVTCFARSWITQAQLEFNRQLGIDAGTGAVLLGFDTDGIWTYATAQPVRNARGPAQQSIRLVAGNSATATQMFNFAELDVVGWIGGNTAVPARATVDGVDVRPTILTAAAKDGTSGWTARVGSTTVTPGAPGSRSVILTATTTNSLVADSADMPCSPGQAILMTTGVQTTTSGKTYMIAATFKDSGGATIGAAEQQHTTSTVTTANGTVQTAGWVTAPANTVSVMFTLRVNSPAVGNTFVFQGMDAIPVTRRGPLVNTTGSFYRYQCTSVALGAHTVILAGPLTGTSSVCDITYVIPRKRRDLGVVFHRFARSGSTTRDHGPANMTDGSGIALSAADAEAVTIASYEEIADGAWTGTVAGAASVNKLPPPILQVITLGVNEAGSGGAISVSEYKANLQASVDKAWAGGTGYPTLLIGGWQFAGNSPMIDGYMTAALEVAMGSNGTGSANCSYFDLRDIWGSRANAEAIGAQSPSLGVHPTFLGHADTAGAFVDALMRQVVSRL